MYFTSNQLITDAIYLNNISKIMVNLAVHQPRAVVVEMEENENEVTNSTEEYKKYCNNVFNILNSKIPLIDDRDT